VLFSWGRELVFDKQLRESMIESAVELPIHSEKVIGFVPLNPDVEFMPAD
jgi:hypothetical protein